MRLNGSHTHTHDDDAVTVERQECISYVGFGLAFWRLLHTWDMADDVTPG